MCVKFMLESGMYRKCVGLGLLGCRVFSHFIIAKAEDDQIIINIIKLDLTHASISIFFGPINYF